MIILYIFCIVVSVLVCFWYFLADVRRSIVQNTMLLVMLLSNLGYLSMALSSDLSSAILSVKIDYTGACFLPLLFFLTVCEVCNFHIKTIYITLLTALQGVLFFFICTIGYKDWFYKRTAFRYIAGVGRLLKEYGPAHILYPITLFAYLFGAIAVVIYTLIRKKNVNKRGLAVMLTCEALASVSYIVQRMMDIHYDFTPVIYIVLMIGALVPIYQSDVFNVVENEAVIRTQLGRVGFISFDNSLHYMGANEYAFNLLPPLREMNLMEKIPFETPDMKDVMGDIMEFIEDKTEQKERHRPFLSNIKIQGRNYETTIHRLYNFMGRSVGVTLEIRDITEHIRMLELTEKYNEKLSDEVDIKTEQIRAIQEKTILGMAQMVESRDLSTGGHIKRTSDVVRIFSEKLLTSDLGFDKHFLKLVVRSAPMHDLGKIGVDDAVLRKQGKFTDEEYEKMKKHSEVGGKMVKDILSGVEDEEFVQIAFNVANYHHEKVNGRGYPCGLKGEEIPIEARIMALADVFDALVSKRCYKDAFTYDKAFSIIQGDAGEHFDATLTPVFISCRPELEAYYNSCDH